MNLTDDEQKPLTLCVTCSASTSYIRKLKNFPGINLTAAKTIKAERLSMSAWPHSEKIYRIPPAQ